jgi:hypothetical protein
MSQLYEALQCLFNPQAGSEHKKNANLFLETYSKTPESWSGCRSLIERQDVDPQIQFFCCNIMYQKVRREWSVLPENLQSEINGWLSNMLGSIAQGKVQCFHLVTQRLSATLAASASLSQGGITAIVNLALQLLQTNTSPITINVAISLLTPLPHEVSEAAITRRRENKLTAELGSQVPRVLGVVSTLLTQQGSPSFLGGAQDQKMCVSVLQCASAWTQLKTPHSVSLAILQSTNLLSFLLQTLVSSEQFQVLEGVSELLVSSMLPESSFLSANTPGDQSYEHLTAIQSVMAAVLATRPRFLQASSTWNPETSQSEQIEKLCRSVCRVATRVGEISCYVVACGQNEIYLRLVNFLMECTSSPIRIVAVETEEFWNALTEIPTAERRPELRKPIFLSLLSTLVRQCRFLGNESGELTDIDWNDERYGAFRQQAFDLLQNTYYLLRSQYFEMAVACMSGGGGGGGGSNSNSNFSSNSSNSSSSSSSNSSSSSSSSSGTNEPTWRERESAMWCIWCVSRVFVEQQRHWSDLLKMSTASQTGAVEPPTAEETEHCRKSSSILTQLLIGIASNPQAFSHPLLVRTVAATIGALSSWIDTVAEMHPQIVQASATYLVTSLRIKGASDEASKGLQRVLNKCGRWMSNPTMVAQLIHEVNSASNQLSPESRQNLIDGIATVIVKMKTNDEARGGLEALVGPVLERLENALHAAQQGMQQQQQGMQQQTNDVLETALKSISDELKTFATAMNHVDYFKQKSKFVSRQRQALQEVAGNVMSRAWPIITAIVAMGREETTNELFDLFRTLLRAMTPLMSNYVSSIVDAAVSSYRRSLNVAALKCLTGVVESYGESQSEPLRQMLVATYEPTASVVQSGPAAMAARAEVIREFFLLVHRVGLFCPSAFTSEMLERLIPLSTQCSTLNEFKPAKQVLLVLVLLLKIPQKSEELQHTTDRILGTNDVGTRLAMTLLNAITTTSPSRLVPSHAEVVYCLAARYSDICQQWIFRFLSNIPISTLSADTKQVVMSLLFDVQSAQNVQRHKKRFKGVLVDLSKICRGEETADVLAGWTMATQSSGGGNGIGSSSALIDLS